MTRPLREPVAVCQSWRLTVGGLWGGATPVPVRIRAPTLDVIDDLALFLLRLYITVSQGD